MQYKSVKGFTGWSQLGFLLVFTGLGFILAALVTAGIGASIMPADKSITDQDAFLKAILLPENVGTARIIQVLGTLCLLFIPAALWSLVSNGRNFFWLGFSKYIGWQQILIGMLIIFTAGIAAGPLADLSKSIIAHFPSLDQYALKQEDIYMQQTMAMSHLTSWGEYITAIFIMCFFPAMFEEVFFRGCMQKFLSSWWKSPMLAILFTSLLFSISHGSVYLLLSRFVLGIALGLMFHETRNIWVNIIAHFLNNMLALSALFVMKDAPAAKKMESIDPHIHWAMGLLAAGVLFGMFMFLKRFSQMNKARIQAKENLLRAEADPFRSFTRENTADGA